MSGRFRSHLRSNIVGYVAIFLFAMSATAIALPGTNTVFSDDIVNGEVQSPDILDGTVGSVDLRDGGIQSQDVPNNELGGNKIANNTVRIDDIDTGAVGSDEILDDTVTGTDLAGSGFGNDGFNGDEEIIDGTITGFDIGANELGGGHIADGSLNGADIAGGLASGAAQNAAVVTLAGGGGTDVVSGTFTNESTSQVIINASAELQGAESDEKALCRILLDGSQISLSYESTFDDIGTSNEATLAVNSFANSVAPGAHTVTMNCISLAGTIVKDDAGINAIAIP